MKYGSQMLEYGGSILSITIFTVTVAKSSLDRPEINSVIVVVINYSLSPPLPSKACLYRSWLPAKLSSILTDLDCTCSRPVITYKVQICMCYRKKYVHCIHREVSTVEPVYSRHLWPKNIWPYQRGSQNKLAKRITQFHV